MAVPVINIIGNVLKPSGAGVAGGSIKVQLVIPGHVADGATEHVIAGTSRFVIGTGGAVDFDLVPTDLITTIDTSPAAYKATFEAEDGESWVQFWAIIASGDDPLDIGDIIVLTVLNPPQGSGIDPTAIHSDASGEILAIADKLSPVGADVLLIEDSASGNVKKRVSITNLPGGADADAIHDNVAAEISVLTEKGTPVAGDHLLIEDSAAANVKKRVQVGNLPGGGGGTDVQVDTGGVLGAVDFQDGGDINFAEAAGVATATVKAGTTVAGIDTDALHDNVAAEISAITEKTAPVDADLVVIEDSAAANAKKRVTRANFKRGDVFTLAGRPAATVANAYIPYIVKDGGAHARGEVIYETDSPGVYDYWPTWTPF